MQRSVVAVAVGLLAIVPVFVPVVSATADEPPRIELTSEDRLWWNKVWLDWKVVNASKALCSIDEGRPFECRPFDANQKLSVAHEGVHQLTITPVDDSAEPVGEPLTLDVGVDRTAPTVSMWRSDTRSRVRVGDPMTVGASYEDAMSGIDEFTCTLVPLNIYADGPVSCTEGVTDGVHDRWNLRSHSRGWGQERFRIGHRFTGRVTVRSLSSRKVVLDAFGLKAVRGG